MVTIESIIAKIESGALGEGYTARADETALARLVAS